MIGHVGHVADQQQMAAEIRRVGKAYVVQTPNQGFPIDWRTYLPLFHWLPAPVQAWGFHHVALGRYPKARDAAEAQCWATRIRNLTAAELAVCFPEGQIARERVAGWTKSFVVSGRPGQEPRDPGTLLQAGITTLPCGFSLFAPPLARWQHYLTCPDPYCVARNEAVKRVAQEVADNGRRDRLTSHQLP